MLVEATPTWRFKVLQPTANPLGGLLAAELCRYRAGISLAHFEKVKVPVGHSILILDRTRTRCLSIVIVEHPTQTLMATNNTVMGYPL